MFDYVDQIYGRSVTLKPEEEKKDKKVAKHEAIAKSLAE